MTRTVMIDIPSVSNIDGDEWKLDLSRILDCVESLKKLKGVQVIFREDIIERKQMSFEESCLFDNILSSIETKPYNLGDLNRARYTTSSPVLTLNTFPSELNDEITVQVHTLHISSNTVFLISNIRRGNSTDNLRTTRDHREKEHKTITLVDQNSIASYVASTLPILDQQKHRATEYSKAGKSVSPFSSYDQRNEQPAKDLLARAYDDYSGNDIDPKYLYTWDYAHKTYVQFRRSAEGTYHGMDYSDLKNVPDDIKAIYHHY